MTRLEDISVYAPEQVEPAELELSGPYIPGHWVHLLEAQGWIEHPDCYGHPPAYVGCEMCFMGLIPPGDTLAVIAKHTGSETDLVREALIEVERARLIGGANGMDMDSGDRSDSGGVDSAVRSDDAEEGPPPDEALA